MHRRCAKCGWSGARSSLFARGHFPVALAFIVVGVNVVSVLEELHGVAGAVGMLGTIIAVFSIPALARRFDPCPQCKDREWETVAEAPSQSPPDPGPPPSRTST